MGGRRKHGSYLKKAKQVGLSRIIVLDISTRLIWHIMQPPGRHLPFKWGFWTDSGLTRCCLFLHIGSEEKSAGEAKLNPTQKPWREGTTPKPPGSRSQVWGGKTNLTNVVHREKAIDLCQKLRGHVYEEERFQVKVKPQIQVCKKCKKCDSPGNLQKQQGWQSRKGKIRLLVTSAATMSRSMSRETWDLQH